MNGYVITKNQLKQVFDKWDNEEFRRMFIYPYEKITSRDDVTKKRVEYFLKLLNDVKNS